MKNKLYSFILILTIALATVSCEPSGNMSGLGNGEGLLTMKMTVANEGNTADAELLKRSRLRIYDSNGDLLRSYAPATDAPAEIALIEGAYKAVLNIDFKNAASFTEKTYYGEQEFTIAAKNISNVSVSCKITNVVVKVTLDPTINTLFGDKFEVVVAASDAFDKAEIDKKPEIALSYDSEGIGYFVLPEGVSNISWGFSGQSNSLGTVIDDGAILTPEKSHMYTLNFKYSKTPGGFMGIDVVVEENGEIYNDDFTFNIQPVIKGDGFDIINTAPFISDPISYLVESFNAVENINITVNGNVYNPFALGAVVDLSAQGIVYTPTNNTMGVLSFNQTFFDIVGSGINMLNISVVDSENNTGASNSNVAISGITNPIVDLWKNNAKLQVVVTDPAVSAVSFKYKESADAEWIMLEATKSVDYLYVAEIAPEWVESKNAAGLTVYTAKDGVGVFANNSYDVISVLNTVESAVKVFTTQVTQDIPQGNFEDSGMSSFTTSNSGSTTWASGNNTFGKGLCTQSTYTGMTGNHVAKLQATSVIGGILAAGSTHFGAFSQSGTSGVAAFGQSYAWTARPKTLKVKYHAKVGKVDISKHSGAPIGKGDQDVSRIFIAITDWTGRHGVKAGTSAPTGLWNPTTMSSVSEGKIIGYGMLDINQSTAGSALIDVEIPIYYYDIVTKPSKAYQLTVNAATSAYGDYMVGCSSNTMYVDDFRFGY